MKKKRAAPRVRADSNGMGGALQRAGDNIVRLERQLDGAMRARGEIWKMFIGDQSTYAERIEELSTEIAERAGTLQRARAELINLELEINRKVKVQPEKRRR